MRKTLLIVLTLWLGGLLLAARADSLTLTLTDGTILSGDIVRYDDNSVMLREPGEVYTNVLWTLFSQDSLKQLAQDPKIAGLVAPFIEPTVPARPPKAGIELRSVDRLEMPPKTSVVGGLFTSSVGWFILLVIYGANLYAAYEIARCCSRPVPVVVGASAVLPLIGPVVFLLLPQPSAATPEAEAVEETPAAPSVPGGAAAPAPAATVAGATVAEAPGEGAHISAASWMPSAEPAAPTPAKPQTVSFQRGKFTFNKRFIETKFSAFAKGAEGDTVMVIMTLKDKFVVQRLGQIGANDLQIICADSEATVTYGEIQEIQIKPKDA